MNQWWTPDDAAALERAASFPELGRIALRIVARMPQPLGQVCGPISTGGFGLIERNLERFREAIRTLTGLGHFIFDQMPFQEPMADILKRRRQTAPDLLAGFYLPLFESQWIRTLYFLPHWHTSVGASWEREQAIRLKLEIVDLDEQDGKIILP